jgi:pectinesterase
MERRRARPLPAAASGIIFLSPMLLLAVTAWAADYYVDPTGKGPGGNGVNTFTTVQAAINGVPAGTTANPTRIRIYPGTYTEHLSVPSNRSNLQLVGMTTNPADTVLTFNLNATSPNGSGGTVGTSGSASTTVSASGFTAANITFANSTPYGIAQAVAFLSQADKTALLNCRFTGFQDTLYLKNGRDYLANCSVTGTVDYIFGNSTALFEGCTVDTALHGATITAPNTTPATAVGYVFHNCRLTADAGVSSASVYLSRPWQYSTADSSNIYLNCQMGSFIRSAGWSTWDSNNTNPGGDTRYAEYASTDLSGNSLNVTGRVNWSHQLTAAQASQFTPNHIFGPGSYWATNAWPAVWQAASNGATLDNHASTYTNWGSGDTWDPTGQLSYLPGVAPGDTNLDGKVDVTDLGNLAGSYGAASGATWSQGDFNHDGAVNVTDLGDLASNYGASSPIGALSAVATAAASVAVPEPCGLLASTLVLLSFAPRRRSQLWSPRPRIRGRWLG